MPTRPARLGVALPQAAALRQPASHAAHTTAVRAAFSPDGRHLATATMDGTIAIRDSRTGQSRARRWSIRRSLSAEPSSAAWSTARMAGIWPPRDTTERFESGIRAAGNYCTRLKGTTVQLGRWRSVRTVERWHPAARIAVCACGT